MKKNSENWISGGELAKRAGVARSNVTRARQAGRIESEQRGKSWFYPPEAVEVFKINEPTGESELQARLMWARVRKEEAEADIRELELDQRKSELVPVQEIEKAYQDKVLAVRSKMLGLPTRLALELSAINSPVTIQNRLIEAFSEALEELAVNESSS